MIGKLQGQVVDIFTDSIIVDVSGVGYRVEGLLGVKVDQQIEIYTYTHVREQELRLFGFLTKDALVMFETLLNVQGVGPKIALKLVDMINVEDIVNAILNDDSQALKVPGLGEKLAKKIIIDLKTKISKIDMKYTPMAKMDDKSEEIATALVALGYQRERINNVIKEIDTNTLDQQGIIKQALRLLNQFK